MDEIIHQLRHSIDDAIAKEILSAKPVVLPMTMTGDFTAYPTQQNRRNARHLQ